MNKVSKGAYTYFKTNGIIAMRKHVEVECSNRVHKFAIKKNNTKTCPLDI
jgi:hypothetical protein